MLVSYGTLLRVVITLQQLMDYYYYWKLIILKWFQTWSKVLIYLAAKERFLNFKFEPFDLQKFYKSCQEGMSKKMMKSNKLGIKDLPTYWFRLICIKF